MTSSIQKWGNSLAVRIPKAYAEQLELKSGSGIELRITESGLELLPLKHKKEKLSVLLEQMNDSNRHYETVWSYAVGGEAW